MPPIVRGVFICKKRSSVMTGCVRGLFGLHLDMVSDEIQQPNPVSPREPQSLPLRCFCRVFGGGRSGHRVTFSVRRQRRRLFSTMYSVTLTSTKTLARSLIPVYYLSLLSHATSTLLRAEVPVHKVLRHTRLISVVLLLTGYFTVFLVYPVPYNTLFCKFWCPQRVYSQC